MSKQSNAFGRRSRDLDVSRLTAVILDRNRSYRAHFGPVADVEHAQLARSGARRNVRDAPIDDVHSQRAVVAAHSDGHLPSMSEGGRRCIGGGWEQRRAWRDLTGPFERGESTSSESESAPRGPLRKRGLRLDGE